MFGHSCYKGETHGWALLQGGVALQLLNSKYNFFKGRRHEKSIACYHMTWVLALGSNNMLS